MLEIFQRAIHEMGARFQRTSEKQNPDIDINTFIVQGKDISWMACRIVTIDEFMNAAFTIPENQEICLACIYYDGPPPESLGHTDMMKRFSDIDTARSWYQKEYKQRGYTDLKIFLRRPLTEKERKPLVELANSHPLYMAEVVTRHDL